jgi:hypothetical protein
MSDNFAITSREAGAGLELRALDRNQFLAELRGSGLTAAASVSSYLSEGLDTFFESLAADWRGWIGERRWSSLEGEFTLRAECDRSGHVYLEAVLHSGAPPVWSATVNLIVEAGQLERLASRARSFQREVITPASST